MGQSALTEAQQGLGYPVVVCKLCASVRPNHQKRWSLTALQQHRASKNGALPLRATASRSRLSIDLGRYCNGFCPTRACGMLYQPANVDFYFFKKGGKGMLIVG